MPENVLTNGRMRFDDMKEEDCRVLCFVPVLCGCVGMLAVM